MMTIGWLAPGADVLAVVTRLHGELELFAAFWLAFGMIDDLAVDLLWLTLVWPGHRRKRRLPPGFARRGLRGPVAVLIPAWQEAAVIGTTVRHALAVWPQPDLWLYVGCYANDPGTISAARAGAGGDPRVRIVVSTEAGPTTKAGCLNHLFRALVADEARRGGAVRTVVLHDAEDMVHPAELAVFDAALEGADFVQLPVCAEPLPSSRWIAGHYLDEFAEAHVKTLMVRSALGAALPAAGVGCAIRRSLLEGLAEQRCRAQSPATACGPDSSGPFTPDSLTEDYEIGWRIARAGGRARFLRLRDHTGGLVATRAYFPETLRGAVRQKTRWTHGIAYQSWDRLGWSGGWADRWMALRDRRAPIAAAVMVAAYASVLGGLALALAGPGLPGRVGRVDPAMALLAPICLLGLGWRLAARFACSAHEHGLAEGLRSIVRAPLANAIAIAAAHRALRAYLRGLGGAPAVWDKTVHRRHPAAGTPPA